MSVLCGNFLAIPIMNSENGIHTESCNYYKETIIPSTINYLKELDWSAKSESHDIDHNYNLFAQTILSSLDTSISLKLINRHNKTSLVVHKVDKSCESQVNLVKLLLTYAKQQYVF